MQSVIAAFGANNKGKKCWSLHTLKIVLYYSCCVAVAITVIALDRLQSGHVKYNVLDQFTEIDAFYCGYNTVTLKCSVGLQAEDYSFCIIFDGNDYMTKSGNGNLVMKRSEIDDSYKTFYGETYFGFLIFAICIPWIIVSFIHICNPLPFWKSTQAMKYFILFSISTVISTIASIFAIAMVTKYDCSTELYNFIAPYIDDEAGQSIYGTFSEDNFTKWEGVTFIFLIINWIGCLALSIFFWRQRNNVKTSNAVQQNATKNDYHEMKDESDDESDQVL